MESPGTKVFFSDLYDYELERSIRSCFFREYGRCVGRKYEEYFIYPYWDGGVDDRGKIHKNVWKKILAFLRSKNCFDYESFIVTNFYVRGCVLPNQLYNETAWDTYHQCIIRLKQYLPFQFLSELNALNNSVLYWKAIGNSKDSMVLALLDKTNSLSPLFRYIVAKTINRPDVAKIFEDAAYKQYSLVKALYRQYWPISGVFPED